MKNCKNPQCFNEMSDNAPDFCPDHNNSNQNNNQCCEKCFHVNMAHSTSKDYCIDISCPCHASAVKEEPLYQPMIESINAVKKINPVFFAPAVKGGGSCNCTSKSMCTYHATKGTSIEERKNARHAVLEEVREIVNRMKIKIAKSEKFVSDPEQAQLILSDLLTALDTMK